MGYSVPSEEPASAEPAMAAAETIEKALTIVEEDERSRVQKLRDS